ncbi:MAG TPA: hypothetical protein VNR38_01340 [Ureibacillus sp.]|nr:hypothetical protein [Ureibacillus sp.]
MSKPQEEVIISGDSKRGKDRPRSPFLIETTDQTIPQTTPSLYTIELFERSNKAVKRLKESRNGKVKI